MAVGPSAAAPANVGGFAIATKPFRYRLVVSIAGLDKSGKTHQALTAPGPQAYANFDTGLEGVAEKFTKAGKVLYRNDYRVVLPPGLTDPVKVAGIANEVWERYKADVRLALASPVIRTVVVDTESETWELIRLARFGKLTQVMPHHYGPVNTEYRNFYNEVFNTDKNMILLGRMKDEWENQVVTIGGVAKEVGKKTGRLERIGMKDVPYLVQVNCRARFDPMAEAGSQFSLEVVNCRQNSELAGTVLPQQACSFTQLATLVYPGSTEADWR